MPVSNHHKLFYEAPTTLSPERDINSVVSGITNEIRKNTAVADVSSVVDRKLKTQSSRTSIFTGITSAYTGMNLYARYSTSCSGTVNFSLISMKKT